MGRIIRKANFNRRCRARWLFINQTNVRSPDMGLEPVLAVDDDPQNEN